jgi:hypothetical protein
LPTARTASFRRLSARVMRPLVSGLSAGPSADRVVVRGRAAVGTATTTRGGGRAWPFDQPTTGAARGRERTCEAISLRRHCPDQVDGGRRLIFQLAGLSAFRLPRPSRRPPSIVHPLGRGHQGLRSHRSTNPGQRAARAAAAGPLRDRRQRLGESAPARVSISRNLEMSQFWQTWQARVQMPNVRVRKRR